jgi:hypothetical protein
MYRQVNAIILLTTLVIGSIFSVLLAAQVTFVHRYGGVDNDEGYCVRQTFDGGYIVVGSTSSFGAGSDDVYLIKTDANGDSLWTHTYGGTDIDWGFSVQQTSDSGYIIAGATESFPVGDWNVYLIKTDVNGDTLWTKTYGGASIDEGHSVQQTSDSGYIIAGATRSFGEGLDWDVYLIKTDASGDTVWTRTHGTMNGSELGRSVQQTSDNGYIIGGYTGNGDVYLIKTEINGYVVWTRTYGGTGIDWGWSVQQTFDGGYIVVGSTSSFGAGSDDVYLIKTDANGDLLWTRTYGGTGIDWGFSVQQTSDSGYIIIGGTDLFVFGTSRGDAYLIKTNVNGDMLWTRTYGTQDFEIGSSVQHTSDGGYIISASICSLVPCGMINCSICDVYLIKTDADGLVTGIEEACFNNIPGRFFITQNFPNPFSSETQIEFALPKEAHVSLGIYNVTGRIVNTLVDRKMDAGYHSVKWITKDVPSGIYFCTIQANTGLETEAYTETKKMILIQ